MFTSYLFDRGDAYLVAKGTKNLLAAAANENDEAEKYVAFKIDVPFRSCSLKINTFSALIDNAEDLDIVMLMYNLLEYSQNYEIRNFMELF